MIIVIRGKKEENWDFENAASFIKIHAPAN
jgi:hypothetical protein